jgi:hypothetical protein
MLFLFALYGFFKVIGKLKTGDKSSPIQLKGNEINVYAT